MLMFMLNACSGGGGGGRDNSTDDDDQGGDQQGDVVETKELLALQISPPFLDLVVNTNASSKVIAIYSDNSKDDVTTEAEWSTASQAIASVTNAGNTKGLLSAHSAGETSLIARYDGLESSIPLTVTEAELIDMRLSPRTLEFTAGVSAQFDVTGIFSNSTTQILNNNALWLSTDDAIASVDESGLVTAHRSGQVTISASIDHFTVNANLQVSAPALTGITITPTSISLAAGTQIALTAVGHYADNSVHDISSQVNWQVANTQIATLTDLSATKIQGLNAGTTTLSASLDNIDQEIQITVTEALIENINIIADHRSVAAGYTTRFYAMATLSDFSTLDISEQVTWHSSNPEVLHVSNVHDDEGIATALSVGMANVTIEYESLTANTAINVTDAELTGINITPRLPAIAVDTQVQFSATGQFSDGSARDITQQALWASSDDNIAAIELQNAETVHVTGLDTGSVQISSSYLNVVGSTTLSVIPAQLERLEIQPSPLQLAAGLQAQLTVTGHYDNSSTQDLTHQVQWQSNNTDIASVGLLGVDTGLIHTHAKGLATISATHIPSGIEQHISLTVTDAVLDSIEISSEASELSNNTTLQFMATGLFSDNSRRDITSEVTWLSSHDALAVISNAPHSKGLAEGRINHSDDNGIVTIKAIINQDEHLVEASTPVNVHFQDNVPVSLTLSSTPNFILNNALDTSTLSVAVRANDNNAQVPDTTMIDFTVIEGDANLNNTSLNTNNGQATITLNSTFSGSIVVEAQIRGTDIKNQITLTSAETFNGAISLISTRLGTVEGNTLKTGARLSYLTTNASNREFTLNSFSFFVEDALAIEDTNQSLFPGGASATKNVVLSNDVTADFLAAEFEFVDPETNSVFTFRDEQSIP